MQLFERIGDPSTAEGGSLTLSCLLEKGIEDCVDFVTELGDLAVKESYIEKV